MAYLSAFEYIACVGLCILYRLWFYFYPSLFCSNLRQFRSDVTNFLACMALKVQNLWWRSLFVFFS